MPETDFFRRYARLATERAVPIQPGQKLLIVAPPEVHGLVRAIAEAAFERGAADVAVLYEDAAFDVLRTASAAPGVLETFPPWVVQALTRQAEAGHPILTLHAPQPGSSPNAERAAQALNARNRALETYGRLRSQVAFTWSVMTVATHDWATFLYPEREGTEALEHLWERLGHLLRLDTPDPLAAWNAHAHKLLKRCEALNALELSELHLRGPGTDLHLGLPEGHRWFGPLVESAQGIVGIPNMPTEEISTLPHRLRAEGTVRATRPLLLQGQVVQGLELTFEAGYVTTWRCDSGAELIEALLETDEGSRRLGEVALVPEDSLVAQEGRIFYSTLIDENASCHLALGRAYPVVLEGGRAMPPETFTARGGNLSRVHLDFMVGSAELQVEATTRGGRTVTLIERGLWALPGSTP
jgi:aminopeptidase